MAGGHLCMLLGQLEVIQEDRHACTAVGKHEVLYTVIWVLLHNIDAHNLNITGRVCY